MKDKYLSNNSQISSVSYKFSNYIKKDPPLKRRRKSLLQRIDKYLLKPIKKKGKKT